jgi:catechol 2,3-dioxygenase-like lactoylglutathione lyase family enzyme
MADDRELNDKAGFTSKVVELPRLHRITAFRMTSVDPHRLARFYVEGIGFRAATAAEIAPREMLDLDLAGSGLRLSLMLGDQRIDLDGFSDPGRPYPRDSTAVDLVFQHCAIVVTDIDAAYRHVGHRGAEAISRDGPVTLPKSAGGVVAVKFRDTEGHPLEFLQFPSSGPSPWTEAAGSRSGALGIDHSAISVSDADASAAFYEACGLRLGHRTLNRGETQAALDAVPAPIVDVVPLSPSGGAPHLELLGYRSPERRRGQPLRPNDIAATRIVWGADRSGLLRDPDGHLHQLEHQP